MQKPWRADMFPFLLLAVLCLLGSAHPARADAFADLQYAVIYGTPERILAALSAGAPINGRDYNNETALVNAIQAGHVENARVLLEKGADKAVTSAIGEPLMHLSPTGNAPMVQLLLDYGLDPNSRFGTYNETLLFKVVMAEHRFVSASIDVLLKGGADLEARRDNGNTPLMEAMKFGSVETLDHLVAKGADLKVRNHGGQSLIFFAVDRGLASHVAWALKHGGDVKDRDKDGKTLVHQAVFTYDSGMLKDSMLRWVIDKKVNLNTPNNSGVTPLMMAVYADYLDKVNLLLENGALVKAVDKEGKTAMHRALDKGSAMMAMALLRKGAAPASQSKYSESAMLIAARNKAMTSLDLTELAKLGVPVNLPDQKGNTPLIEVIRRGAWEAPPLVTTLLGLGVNVNAVNKEGQSPLTLALMSTLPLSSDPKRPLFDAMLLELLDKGANPNTAAPDSNTPLLYAIDKELPGVLKKLLEKGALVTQANKEGMTPLHLAAGKCVSGSVALLLAHNAPLDVVDSGGGTPLWLAVRQKQAACVKMLKGSPLETPNKEGFTPLMAAVFQADQPTVVALIDMGASLVTKNSRGENVLHAAAAGGDAQIVKYLIEKGAPLNEKTTEGKTPLDIANVWKKAMAAQAIEEAGGVAGSP